MNEFSQVAVNHFYQLALPFLSEKELRATLFLTTYLSQVGKNESLLCKNDIVDGFYTINDYGVMSVVTNGSGILDSELDETIRRINKRKFLILYEKSGDYIHCKINLNFFVNEISKYLPKSH